MSQIFFELFACIKLTFDGKFTSDIGRFLNPKLFNNLILFTDNWIP